MNAVIYFTQFLKDDAKSVGGGGIGTEISYLCPLLHEMGYKTTVYQCAGHAFETTWRDADVIGVPIYPSSKWPNEKLVQHFRDLAINRLGSDEKLELFMGDFFSVKNNNPFAICVQNGLAWDAPIELLTANKLYYGKLAEKIFRFRCQLRGLRRFETCFNRVAVDLYFVNWYRSFRGLNYPGRLFYNPNPAPVAPWLDRRDANLKKGRPLKIIFARRLVLEKGTRLIADVIKDLIKARSNIEVTFAGEGPEREFLVHKFSGNARVSFITYKTEESLEIHQQHDIALMPSLCGEGLSLAAQEAMAAGCAVVATNLGGTITQIINGYNGILVWPDKQSIINGIFELIDSPDRMLQLQKRAWETSQTAFSLTSWRENWKLIIDTVLGK